MGHKESQASESSRRSVRLPFDAAERKKVIVMACLGLICLVVVATQVWKKKGPASAQAAGATTAAPSVDLEKVIREVQESEQKTQKSDGRNLFRHVDDALEMFANGWNSAPVPAKELNRLAFDTLSAPLRTAGGKNAKGAESATPGRAAAAEAKSAKPVAEPQDALAMELAKLRLETILISARNQSAIINGQVLHAGELVNGFKIAKIDPDRVTLTCEGRNFSLTLE